MPRPDDAARPGEIAPPRGIRYEIGRTGRAFGFGYALGLRIRSLSDAVADEDRAAPPALPVLSRAPHASDPAGPTAP